MSIDLDKEIFALERAIKSLIKVSGDMYQLVYFEEQITDEEEEQEFDFEIHFSELDDRMGSKKIHTAYGVYHREKRTYELNYLSSSYLFDNFYSYFAFPFIDNKKMNQAVNFINFLSSFCFGEEIFEPFVDLSQLKYHYYYDGNNYNFKYSKNIESIDKKIPFGACIRLSFFIERDQHKTHSSMSYIFKVKDTISFASSRDDFIKKMTQVCICEPLGIQREDIRSSHYKLLNILNYQ